MGRKAHRQDAAGKDDLGLFLVVTGRIGANVVVFYGNLDGVLDVLKCLVGNGVVFRLVLEAPVAKRTKGLSVSW